MSKGYRKIKEDQFKAGTVAVHMSFFSNLLICACSELSLSLEERRDYNARLGNNHYSRHAVGSIVLLVTALDSFLNEELMVLGLFDTDIRELAKLTTCNKYYEIIKKLGGDIQPNNDLDDIINLRNEIVHYVPRNVSEMESRRYLPEAFYRLYEKGLFFNLNNDETPTPFGMLVCSYRLAYWVWENVDIAVNNFVGAFASTKRPDHINHSNQYLMFKMYEKIISPDNLAIYDTSNGLELTI